jgi:hypothetical protein
VSPSVTRVSGLLSGICLRIQACRGVVRRSRRSHCLLRHVCALTAGAGLLLYLGGGIAYGMFGVSAARTRRESEAGVGLTGPPSLAPRAVKAHPHYKLWGEFWDLVIDGVLFCTPSCLHSKQIPPPAVPTSVPRIQTTRASRYTRARKAKDRRAKEAKGGGTSRKKVAKNSSAFDASVKSPKSLTRAGNPKYHAETAKLLVVEEADSGLFVQERRLRLLDSPRTDPLAQRRSLQEQTDSSVHSSMARVRVEVAAKLPL